MKVIFRKYKPIRRLYNGGDNIVAIFPEEPGTYEPWTCMVYEHIGQHGQADYRTMIELTTAAKPEEYANLLAELKSIGYDDLEIRQRSSPAMVEARRKALER